MTSLHDTLRSGWEADPDRAFLEVPGGRAWTYGDIDRLAGQMGEVLRAHGADRSERVMVQVDKSPHAVALYLAVLRTGAVYVPLNIAYTHEEVKHFVADAAPAVFVAANESVRAAVPDAVPVLTLSANDGGTLGQAARSVGEVGAPAPGSGDAVVAMLFTSGTTGRSKGAMLTSDNLVSNAVSLHRIWGWENDDVLLHVLPIFHTHGLFVALHCAMLGASRVWFPSRFAVDAVKQLLPESTVMMGVPTYYGRLLADDNFGSGHTSGMRLFTSGSSPLPVAAHRAFAARTGHEILERYGMTETGMITSNPYDGERIAGTVGYPLPDVELRVVDDDGRELPPGAPGGVEVRGPNVFAGYWRMPDKTAGEFRADGFYRTGDIGFLAGDGRLTLAGRSSDLIISGGLNVYPKEVELVLDEVAGVAESAVVGVPHPDFGEAVVAFIVGTADEAMLRDGCRRLAPFKRPKAYIFVDQLPRNAMGKVQKQTLRQSHAGVFVA